MFMIMTRSLTLFSLENNWALNAIKKVGSLITGWLFILIGLAVLSSRSEVIKWFLKHLEERYPQHHERVEI